ncbi:MAG: ExbD/TolR family protein [Prochlorococcus sp.]
MYFKEDNDKEFDLNIIPMIDVIFAILTFFIISSLLLTQTKSLPVTLPKATSGELKHKNRIDVTINKSGNIYVNKIETTQAKLPTLISDLIKSDASNLVVIFADQATSHGQVVSVMDMLGKIDDVSIGVAINPKV